MKAISFVSDDYLEKLATMADKIGDCSESTISAISTKSDNRMSRLDNIEIESLCNKMESFGRSRSVFRKSGNHKRSKSKHDKPLCWYHFKFGDKAKKCVTPCNFNPQTEEN